MTQPLDLDAIQARCPVPGCTRETYADPETHTVDLYDHLNDVHGAAGVRALEHIARQQAARVRDLEAELATERAVAESNRRSAKLLADDVKRLTATLDQRDAAIRATTDGILQRAKAPSGRTRPA
ncbi:hypothetical protein AB0O91_21155 [Kitasatospora sp. NPDC089797]|uniref:hypothetical protein n=1 Tax=Kitasatospora sp. NPDC089797 TaxID=3155298 RepID=UPI003425409D